MRRHPVFLTGVLPLLFGVAVLEPRKNNRVSGL